MTKAELSMRIQKRIQAIPAKRGGSITVSPTTLRQFLSLELLERICDEAADVALSIKD